MAARRSETITQPIGGTGWAHSVILLTHHRHYCQHEHIEYGHVTNASCLFETNPLYFANLMITPAGREYFFVTRISPAEVLIFRGFSPLAPTHPPAKPPTPGPCYPSLYVPPRRTDSHPETGLKICQKWTSECHSSRWLAPPSCHISLQVPVGAVAGHLQPSSVPRNPRRHL